MAYLLDINIFFQALTTARTKRLGPFGHWGASTFMTALRYDRIDALWVFNGAANGDAFRVYVETQLVPTLRRGDIVIMDNLSSHKTKAVSAATRSASTRLLFLPPYSSDLNPIEQAFAKLKHFLRKDQPLNRDDLWKTSAPSWKSSSLKNARTASPTKAIKWVKLSAKRSRIR